jgi:hypothetical protein
LWGRRSRYDDPASPYYLPHDKRRFEVNVMETTVQWPALPERSISNESSSHLTEL